MRMMIPGISPRVSKTAGIDKTPRPICVLIIRTAVPNHPTLKKLEYGQKLQTSRKTYVAVVGPIFSDVAEHCVMLNVFRDAAINLASLYEQRGDILRLIQRLRFWHVGKNSSNKNEMKLMRARSLEWGGMGPFINYLRLERYVGLNPGEVTPLSPERPTKNSLSTRADLPWWSAYCSWDTKKR